MDPLLPYIESERKKVVILPHPGQRKVIDSSYGNIYFSVEKYFAIELK